MADTHTVMAHNSLGRLKAMTKEEYTRRAVTDHRCMAFDDETYAIAQRLYEMQHELASRCFEQLHTQQSKS